MNPEDKNTLEVLKSAEIFNVIEKMSDIRLKAIYAIILKFGPQNLGQEATDRHLTMLGYELSRRENNRSFRHTLILTYVAVGLTVFQAVLSIVEMCRK